MELLNHDFFVFKNIDEECVSVIYQRKDKGYGIINVKQKFYFYFLLFFFNFIKIFDTINIVMEEIQDGIIKKTFRRARF